MEQLIVKFFNKEADMEEMNQLEDYLKKDDIHKTFEELARIDYLIKCIMTDFDVEKAKVAIKKKIKERERKRMKALFGRIAIAASLLIFMGLSFLIIYDDSNDKAISTAESSVLKAGTDKAILTLYDGSQVALEKGKEFQTEQLVSSGDELIYSNNTKSRTKSEKQHYNYLTIPRGGQYFVQLSDDTKVWLNSDSKLKYPVNFKTGEKREVELLYGEAYFEVSPSVKHDGAKFNVLSKAQEIEVLGTKFSIKTYDGEDKIMTTLVEGKVQVNFEDIQKTLKPNQQSQIDMDNRLIQVIEIDAAQEVSWVNGLFTFEDASLHEMMKVLSRWYDTEVFYEKEEFKKFRFTGILERTKSIGDILKLVEASSDGQLSIEIKERVVIVK
jgi:ferric-dicitrate binding protein FerR (iron transport regulator)